MGYSDLYSILFWESVIGCLLSFRMLAFYLFFTKYICISTGGYSFSFDFKAKLSGIIGCISGIFVFVLGISDFVEKNSVDDLYFLIFTRIILVLFFVFFNYFSSNVLVYNVMLKVIVAAGKDECFKNSSVSSDYEFVQYILKNHKQSLPWYSEGFTLLTWPHFMDFLLLRELEKHEY